MGGGVGEGTGKGFGGRGGGACLLAGEDGAEAHHMCVFVCSCACVRACVRARVRACVCARSCVCVSGKGEGIACWRVRAAR